jgi:hypothetical protein
LEKDLILGDIAIEFDKFNVGFSNIFGPKLEGKLNKKSKMELSNTSTDLTSGI